MIDRQQAEIFLTLARELHFGRTADLLRLSTSRVSQTVRSLERSVGAPLFRRTSRRVELTELGTQLENELRPAWGRVEEVWRRAVDRGHGRTGSLGVAFIGPAAGQLMARATHAFTVVSPRCEVTLMEWSSFDVTARLVAREADLALSVVAEHEPGISRGPVLTREAWVLALPTGHPYTRRDALRPVDLARLHMLELQGMPHVDPRPGRPAKASARQVATLTEGLTLVGAGLGALAVGASVPRYHPRPDVSYVPLSGDASIQWRMAWSAECTTERILSFVRTAQQVVS